MVLSDEEKIERRRISRRLSYLKKIKGDIRYFNINNVYDEKLLNFLKMKDEFKKLFSDEENEKSKSI